MTRITFMMHPLFRIVTFFLIFFTSFSTAFSVEVDAEKFYSLMEHRLVAVEECHEILETHIDDETFYYLMGISEGVMNGVDMFDDCIIKE